MDGSRPGASFLHYDGQFRTAADLVRTTFTGRDFGWLPAERDEALAHVAHVLRHHQRNLSKCHLNTIKSGKNVSKNNRIKNVLVAVGVGLDAY